jgi:hypothetical protein
MAKPSAAHTDYVQLLKTHLYTAAEMLDLWGLYHWVSWTRNILFHLFLYRQMSWNKFWSSFFDPKPAFKKTHFSAKNQTFRDQHFDFFSFYPVKTLSNSSYQLMAFLTDSSAGIKTPHTREQKKNQKTRHKN